MGIGNVCEVGEVVQGDAAEAGVELAGNSTKVDCQVPERLEHRANAVTQRDDKDFVSVPSGAGVLSLALPALSFGVALAARRRALLGRGRSVVWAVNALVLPR